jgi:outer membrane protein TolC
MVGSEAAVRAERQREGKTMSDELERAEAHLHSAEGELHKAEHEEAVAVRKIEAAVEEIKEAEEHRVIHFTVDGEPHKTD